MKKNYMTPSVKEIALRCDGMLLEGSDNSLTVDNSDENAVGYYDILSKDDDNDLW